MKIRLLLYIISLILFSSCSISNEKVDLSSIKIISEDSILTDSNVYVNGVGLTCTVKKKVDDSQYQLEWLLLDPTGRIIKKERCEATDQTHMVVPSFYLIGNNNFKYKLRVYEKDEVILDSDVREPHFLKLNASVGIDHIVIEKNDSTIVVHSDIVANNLMQCPLNLRCYFYDKNGNNLKDTNYKVCDEGGNVVIEKDIVPKSRFAEYKDLKLIIPAEELHTDYNKKPAYMVIFVRCKLRQNIISQSSKIRF